VKRKLEKDKKMKENQGLEEEQERIASQHHLNGSLEVGFPLSFIPHA